MAQIKTVITICVLGAIFAVISAKNDPVVVDAQNEAGLEQELGDSLRKLDKDFEQAAKCIKERMENGVPSLKIPRLEPFTFPVVPLIINNNLIKSKMMLYGIKLEGLGQFNLTDGALEGGIFIPNRLHIRVHFNTIRFSTGYEGSMTLINMLKLFGKGNAKISLKNFALDMTIKIKVNVAKLRMKITGLVLKMTLPSTEAKITGLLNDERMSKLISEQLSDVFTTLALEQNENLNTLAYNTLWQILNEDINEILKDVNALKIQGMMKQNIKMLCGEQYMGMLYQQFQTKIADYLQDEFQEKLFKKYLDMSTTV